MAATSSVTISSALWTLVSTALEGTIENQTGEAIKVAFASSLPDAGSYVGHVIGSTESVQWNVTSGSIYARIVTKTTSATITGPVVVTV